MKSSKGQGASTHLLVELPDSAVPVFPLRPCPHLALTHALLVKWVKTFYWKKPEMELDPTFSPHLFPYMGQTTIFGLTPSPLIDGDKPAPAPQEREGGFLAAKRVPPATYLSPSLQFLPRAPPP